MMNFPKIGKSCAWLPTANEPCSFSRGDIRQNHPFLISHASPTASGFGRFSSTLSGNRREKFLLGGKIPRCRFVWPGKFSEFYQLARTDSSSKKKKSENPLITRVSRLSRLAGAEGLEPPKAVLETAVMPFHHAPKKGIECDFARDNHGFGDRRDAISLCP